MKTKNQNNLRIISCMLPIIVLLVSSCGSNNSQNKPTDPPKDTTAAAPKPDAAAESPASKFYGTWEREENGIYSTETFSKATKDGEKYKGTISEQSNLVIADYTVHENSIEIAYNNSHQHGASTFKFDFSVSNGGNTITLASTPPIVYNKGSQNTSLQDEAYSFVTTNIGTWQSADNPNVGLDFSDVAKSDQGWSGTYKKWDTGTVVESGEFTIPKAGSITMKPVGVAAKTYVYKFKNNNAILELTRDNHSDVYKR